MKTSYTIIKPDGSKFEDFAMLADEPNYDDLAKVLNPIFREQRGGAHFEHVAVLNVNNKPVDMFVDEEGACHQLPVNLAATRHYHRDMLRRDSVRARVAYKGVDPMAAHIYGVAVLFDRRVWF